MLFKEEAVLAILTYRTSRTETNAHLPPLPIVLQTMEDLPLPIHLKGWIIREMYMHHLEELMAVHMSLSQMSSTGNEKTTDDSVDNLGSS
jgi:hypothetical protein